VKRVVLSCLETALGALYWLAVDRRGQWWAYVPTRRPNNGGMTREGWLPIDPPEPWPPVPGESVVLAAAKWVPIDDARRMPGGGRVTGPVCWWSSAPRVVGPGGLLNTRGR
jgi:hypothetical protein